MTIILEIGVLCEVFCDSKPAGGPLSSRTFTRLESYASRLVLPAKVSFDVVPSGRKNDSNLPIAPLVLERSFAFRTWVVDLYDGPKICLAISLHIAVLPTPVGPEISKCGGLACNETFSMLLIICLGNNKSWKRKGDFVSNQDGILSVVCRRSFNPARNYFHSAGSLFVLEFLRNFMKTRDPHALQLIPLRSLWNDSILPHTAHL